MYIEIIRGGGCEDANLRLHLRKVSGSGDGVEVGEGGQEPEFFTSSPNYSNVDGLHVTLWKHSFVKHLILCEGFLMQSPKRR